MGGGAAAPVVLLSPACASYDQFRNFEIRGDAFRALVEALPGIELRRRDGRAGAEGEGAAVSKASVMLAAGGTGGHLYPAFALAQELGRREIPVDLVTDMRGDRYGANFPARAVYRVPSATLASRSPIAAGRTVWMLGRGIAASYSLLGTVKPGAVVGFGGYPAFPPILAATLRGIPTALHEQNAVLGRANRLLSGRVTVIATSFENTKYLSGGALKRARLTGNPVRDQVVDWATQSYRIPGPTVPTRCWCSAAARARASSPTRCRRP